MGEVTLSKDMEGCGVKIVWTEPKDVESVDVSEYKVEINTSKGF